MPASLFEDQSQEKLANALFAASRFSDLELHFNKGLAGSPAEAIEAARDTAMNPAVCGALALAIVADGQGAAYPGISVHQPDLVQGRKGADAVIAYERAPRMAQRRSVRLGEQLLRTRLSALLLGR